MPRLLIIHDHLRHGGSESHTVWLAHALRRAGTDVRVLTFRPGGPLARRAAESGVPVGVLQKTDTGLDWYAPGLTRAVREASPDRVLLMGKVANAYARHLRGRFPDLVIVGSVRTGFALPWFVRRSLGACDALVCNCAAVADSLSPLGVAREKVTVIPNPPVLAPSAPDATARATVRGAYGASQDAVVLLCVAGFRRHKGQASLIRALAKVPSGARVTLWLAGDGPERAACERLAVELGVAERVKFPGHVADPRPLYLAADLATMASETDAMSNFLVESQLHGLPVVAWDFAGTRETFVHDVSGILTPFGDTFALAAAWGALAADSERRRTLASVAAVRAPEVFSEKAALAAYRKVFGF